MASWSRSASWRDERVAGLMAQRVVHQLEVVEVDRDHGDGLVGTARPREGQLQQLVEHGAVRHARQLVVVREERDLLLGGAAVGDVQHHALHQMRAPIGVAEHDGAVAEPQDAAVPRDQPVLEDERVARRRGPAGTSPGSRRGRRGAACAPTVRDRRRTPAASSRGGTRSAGSRTSMVQSASARST